MSLHVQQLCTEVHRTLSSDNHNSVSWKHDKAVSLLESTHGAASETTPVYALSYMVG